MRIESKGRLSTLTFFNVSEKDYGNYTCVATNKLGNTNASIILYGRCPGFFSARYSKEVEEEEDEEEKRKADGCRWSNRAELAVFNVAGL